MPLSVPKTLWMVIHVLSAARYKGGCKCQNSSSIKWICNFPTVSPLNHPLILLKFLYSFRNSSAASSKPLHHFKKYFIYFLIFFESLGPYWGLRTEGDRPITLSVLFNFLGAIQQFSSLTEGHDTAQPRLLFVSDRSWQSPRSFSLSFQVRAFT